MEYTVLYTHQKQKKAKTWQDGFLKLPDTGHRASLTDVKGVKLDVVHLKFDKVEVGEELESDRYLIQIEEMRKASYDQSLPSLQQQTGTNSCVQQIRKPTGQQPVRASGLKRKNTGFKPPRIVRPKIDKEDDEDKNKKADSNFHCNLSNNLSQNTINLTNQSPVVNFSSLYSKQTKENDNLHTSSNLSLPSPWSVIGKNKTQSNFSTPYSNKSIANVLKNTDCESQMQSTSLKSLSDDSEMGKNGLNNQTTRFTQKRSTTEILALLGGKKPKFQVPVMPLSQDKCFNLNRDSVVQNTCDKEMTDQGSEVTHNQINAYEKGHHRQMQNVLVQDETLKPCSPPETNNNKQLSEIPENEELDTVGRGSNSSVIDFQIDKCEKTKHENLCTVSDNCRELDCTTSQDDNIHSDISSLCSNIEKGQQINFKATSSIIYSKNSSLIDSKENSQVEISKTGVNNVESDSSSIKNICTNQSNNFHKTNNSPLNKFSNEEEKHHESCLEGALSDTLENTDANDTGCFDINFSPLSNVSISEEESNCGDMDSSEIVQNVKDISHSMETCSNKKMNISDSQNLKNTDMEIKSCYSNIGNNGLDYFETTVCLSNNGIVNNSISGKLSTGKNLLQFQGQEGNVNIKNKDSNNSSKCEIFNDEPFDDELQYISSSGKDINIGTESQEKGNIYCLENKFQVENNRFSPQLPSERIAQPIKQSKESENHKKVAGSKISNKDEIFREATLVHDSAEQSERMNLHMAEFTPESNCSESGVMQGDSIEKVLSEVAMHVNSTLLPHLDKHCSEKTTQSSNTSQIDNNNGTPLAVIQKDVSQEDQTESMCPTQTTVDTLATFSQDSIELLDLQQTSEQLYSTSHSVLSKNNVNVPDINSPKNEILKLFHCEKKEEFQGKHINNSEFSRNIPYQNVVNNVNNASHIFQESPLEYNPQYHSNPNEKSYSACSSAVNIGHHGSCKPFVNTTVSEDFPKLTEESTTGGMTCKNLQTSLHLTLPHPNELIGKGSKQVLQSEDPIKEPKDVLLLANSKLKNYTVKGSMMGIKATRDFPVAYCQDSSTVDEKNTSPTQLSFSVDLKKEMEAPNTPDLFNDEEQENSLYYFNPRESFKKQFGNETNFMVTPKDYLQNLINEKPSPVQLVPCRQWNTSPEKNKFRDYENMDRNYMKPVIAKVYENQKDIMEEMPLQSEINNDRIIETPVQNKVPIWMKQSPGDISFSDSPFFSNSESRFPVDKENVITMGLDHDSQDSQVPDINLVVSEDDFSTNKCVAEVLKSNIQVKNELSLQTGIATNYPRQFGQLRPVTLYNPAYKESNSQSLTKEQDIQIFPGSKWDRFGTELKAVEKMAFKSDFNISEPNSSLGFGCHTNNFSKTSNHNTKLTLHNLKTGVDHLVPDSPTGQSLIELTSDVSTDNDSECTINDNLFEESFLNESNALELLNCPSNPVGDKKLCHAQNENVALNDQPNENISLDHNVVQPNSDLKTMSGQRYRKGFRVPRSSVTSTSSVTVNKSSDFAAPYNKHLLNSESKMYNELHFPSNEESETIVTPCRQITIPVTFSSVSEYKQVFSAALNEYLNVQLFELSKNYHTVLSKVDVCSYTPSDAANFKTKQRSVVQNKNTNPPCEHGQPSKILQVKKDGPNKGRFFFVCNGQRNNQCKYFKWANETGKDSQKKSNSAPGIRSLSLTDADSIGTYFKGQGIPLYCECLFLRKVSDGYKPHLKHFPKWAKHKEMEISGAKKKMYVRLSRKESSLSYTKDDLWVVSQHLSFDPSCTFMAKSVFFGPTANSEIEIEPISGYSPSNWNNECMCHAIHAGNASNELICLSNLQEFIQPTHLPILPSLLSLNSSMSKSYTQQKKIFYGHWNIIKDEAEELIEHHKLNEYQAQAVRRVADMFNSESQERLPTISLIHGVFGAGKSFLLAVIVKFIVKVFEMKDIYATDLQQPSKLLISSTTNVAVDRILLGLLDLNFDQFVRVGSIKKIAKPVLPYSMHATGTDSQELKELQEMLKSETTPQGKVYIRKRLDQLRKGENKRQLEKVRVVGATCAACPFQSLKGFKFSVVILDECSQITEPASLLPIARFSCEKLVLVGGPKQLDPTLQGAEAVHQQGLEQTLFDRLIKMGYDPTMLKTQYRCHPSISAISNNLFYDNQLCDGVTEEDRLPLVENWPTLCFYDVSNGIEMCERSNSYANEEEASFVVLLIETMVMEGVSPTDIGVITLYKAQQVKISQLLHSSSLDTAAELKAIQISTVDAFQGGERGVIILSTVRTNSTGFMDNDKRTNVALTRSRNHLLIVGNRNNLRRNSLWSKVLNHCCAAPSGVENAKTFKMKLLHRKNELSDNRD